MTRHNKLWQLYPSTKTLRMFASMNSLTSKNGDRLEVRTEGNWVASLFGIVPAHTGQVGYGEKAAYSQVVLVGTAVIGSDAWSIDDRVRLTQFRVPPADIILRHWPTHRRIANDPGNQFDRPDAFDVSVIGGNIRVHSLHSGLWIATFHAMCGRWSK